MFHANFHGDFFNLSKMARRPGPPRAGRVLGGRAARTLRCAGRQGSCEDVSISSGRARLPLLSLFFFLSAAVRGFLSHDGFIGPHFLLILSSSFSCLAYQRRFVGHRAGTPHIKSSALSPPPRSFASLFLRDAGGGWGSLITRSVVKRHMLALKEI